MGGGFASMIYRILQEGEGGARIRFVKAELLSEDES